MNKYNYNRKNLNVKRNGENLEIYYNGVRVASFPAKDWERTLGVPYIAFAIGMTNEKILSLKYGDECYEDESEDCALACEIEEDFEYFVMYNHKELGLF